MTTLSSTTTYTIPTITPYVHLGALPTVTTLPPQCLTNALDFQVNGIGLPYTYYTIGCALSSCCPSSNFYSSAFQWYSEYYSPAVCPSGYEQNAADPIISTRPGETVRFCCPSGYGGGTAGQSPVAASLTAPYYNWICQSVGYQVSTATVYDNVVDQKSVSVESGSLPYNYLMAYPIQIRWKAGDFDNIATLTSTSVAAGKTSTTQSTTATPTKTPSSKGLSSGAIAGICVALGLLAIGAVVAIVFWLRRQSKRRSESHGEKRDHATPAGRYERFELDHSQPRRMQPQELFATPEIGSDSHPRYEL